VRDAKALLAPGPKPEKDTGKLTEDQAIGRAISILKESGHPNAVTSEKVMRLAKELMGGAGETQAPAQNGAHPNTPADQAQAAGAVEQAKALPQQAAPLSADPKVNTVAQDIQRRVAAGERVSFEEARAALHKAIEGPRTPEDQRKAEHRRDEAKARKKLPLGYMGGPD
jgi:hypothetical protein